MKEPKPNGQENAQEQAAARKEAVERAKAYAPGEFINQAAAILNIAGWFQAVTHSLSTESFIEKEEKDAMGNKLIEVNHERLSELKEVVQIYDQFASAAQKQTAALQNLFAASVHLNE